MLKGVVPMPAESPAQGLLVHNVYFTLKEDSPSARQRLLDACRTYLHDHPGIVFFAAGTLVEDLDRPVNVRDFHVGLHIVFSSRDAHNEYQTSAKHLTFIEENKATWAEVRVFDTQGRDE
jgi:hypothetical protein